MSEEVQDFVAVHTLTDRFEADVLRDTLSREDIPVLIRTFEETAYAGLFVSQRGWGWVMVPRAYALEAQKIIQTTLKDLEFKEIYSNPLELDHQLWEKLRAAHHADVTFKTGVWYHSESNAYLIPFFNTRLLCFPQQEIMEIEKPGVYPKIDFNLTLVTLKYLLKKDITSPTGKWIGEKEIPGGESFFRGPHQMPVAPLMELFGSNLDLFNDAARSLGGESVPMGDMAFAVSIFPKLPMLALLWEGDEEFPAAMHLRFDETIQDQVENLDVIFALSHVFCRALEHAGEAFLKGPA